MAKTHNLKVGQKVRFRPTHQPELELEGTIAGVSDDHDIVDVTAEPDGKKIEVKRNYQAHARHVTVVADAA
jgi:predicted transcriptional regulator